LTDYVRLVHTSHVSVCSCPPDLWPSRGVGVYHGRHINLDLSICTACGLGATADADLEVLLPGFGN
jgi:hypothetical protein